MRIIAGRFRGKKLNSPNNDNIRPTSDRVRQAIFNILASKLENNFEDKNVLDLFAGTGAMGIEAISRGAQSVIFVDNGIEARAIIRKNIEDFALGGKTKLLKRDALNLGRNEKFTPFNLIFVDPPYGKNLGQEAILSAYKNGWIANDAIIILEEKAGQKIEFSANLELIDKRKYGNSNIYFCAFN